VYIENALYEQILSHLLEYIIVYCLYGFLDTPQDFLQRIIDLIEWGVVTYPMRYQPLEPCNKDSYISPNWQSEQLEMVARARRVIGYGGAFPPYEGFRKKLINAKNFEEAFSLRPKKVSIYTEDNQKD
jgi:hypothetical protein